MTADDHIRTAIDHMESGDFGGAVNAFAAAFELAKTDERLPWEIGRLSLYHLSKPADAVRWFETSLPLITNPVKDVDTRYQIGLAHVFLEEDDRARVRFEEVLERLPTHVLTCIELGKLLTRAGEHERAKDLLQQAVLHNQMRSTLPEMFPDGQRGSAHAAALAWLNLGRLSLVVLDGEGEFEAHGRNAVVRLLEDLGDENRAFMLATEALDAGSERGAVIALDALLERVPDHEGALALVEPPEETE